MTWPTPYYRPDNCAGYMQPELDALNHDLCMLLTDARAASDGALTDDDADQLITRHQRTVAQLTDAELDALLRRHQHPAPGTTCGLCVALVTLPGLRQALVMSCQCGARAGRHAVRHPHRFLAGQCTGFSATDQKKNGYADR